MKDIEMYIGLPVIHSSFGCSGTILGHYGPGQCGHGTVFACASRFALIMAASSFPWRCDMLRSWAAIRMVIKDDCSDRRLRMVISSTQT